MITKLRKKMKKYLFLLQDRIMLRKRSTVETMNNNLREFGIRKGLKKLVISSKIRIFIGENQ